MSYSTVKAVFPGEKHYDYLRLHNGWGSAPYVWNELFKKYYGAEDHAWGLCGVKINELFNRWDDIRIPKHHRAVLMMTGDNILVSKKYYRRAAQDISAFIADFGYKYGSANHWPIYMGVFEVEPDIPAISFWHTSVDNDPFMNQYDEETETYSTDWSVFVDIYEMLDTVKKVNIIAR